jgi:TfoX/Sxy family transcriptional regulator of competence genes
MKEYVALPRSIRSDRKELAAWVSKALEYGKSLKPKSKAKKPVRARVRKRSA